MAKKRTKKGSRPSPSVRLQGKQQQLLTLVRKIVQEKRWLLHNRFFLLGCGVFFLGVCLVMWAMRPVSSHPQQNKSVKVVKEQVYTFPQRIIIPDIKVNAHVIEGGFVKGQWILSDTDALYVPSSGKVGEGYNTIIYAHKRPGLFVDLGKVKKGTKIYVQDMNGKMLAYTVYSIENVLPESVDSLQTFVPNTVTLFTCDGIFDTSRRLVKAKQ